MTKPMEKMGRLMRIFCAIGLILIGFAHKPPQILTVVPFSELALYVMPDGSLPVICSAQMHDDGTRTGQIVTYNFCEACLLSGSALPPAPPMLALAPKRGMDMPPPANAAGPSTPFRLTAAPRGPPLSLST